MPAILIVLAGIPSPSTGRSEAGIFRAQLVAVGANTGALIAGTLGGCTCNAASPPANSDGTYELDRMPAGQNYIINAEPLEGIVNPSDFGQLLEKLCAAGPRTEFAASLVNLNFSVRVRRAGP